MARLSQNFKVLKGDLGFNNPDIETTWFSLRKELFRILPEEGDLNPDWEESNRKWREMLEGCYFANVR